MRRNAKNLLKNLRMLLFPGMEKSFQIVGGKVGDILKVLCRKGFFRQRDHMGGGNVVRRELHIGSDSCQFLPF